MAPIDAVLPVLSSAEEEASQYAQDTLAFEQDHFSAMRILAVEICSFFSDGAALCAPGSTGRFESALY